MGYPSGLLLSGSSQSSVNTRGIQNNLATREGHSRTSSLGLPTSQRKRVTGRSHQGSDGKQRGQLVRRHFTRFLSGTPCLPTWWAEGPDERHTVRCQATQSPRGHTAGSRCSRQPYPHQDTKERVPPLSGGRHTHTQPGTRRRTSESKVPPLRHARRQVCNGSGSWITASGSAISLAQPIEFSGKVGEPLQGLCIRGTEILHKLPGRDMPRRPLSRRGPQMRSTTQKRTNL